jgi:hypothetical protein
MAKTRLPVDCGVFGVSFTTETGDPLDFSLFNDGLNAKDGTQIKAIRTSFGKEDRVFTIYKPLDT